MRQFTATVLLEREWQMDAGAVAAALGRLYPQIGQATALPAAQPGAGAVWIEGAAVTLALVPPLAPERMAPALKPIRSWDAAPAIRGHVGGVEVSCGGELPGLEGAEAYAAAVHFVAAAVCAVAPASAVLWHGARALSEPRVFVEGAAAILRGRMPLPAWVSFAAIVPRGAEAAAGDGRDAAPAVTGMVTYGMRPFLGRELELAPRPGDARAAWGCIGRVARLVLNRGLALSDGQRLADPGGAFALTVRARTFWLRRNLSAYVLVADDAVVDPATLRPRGAAAGEPGGAGGGELAAGAGRPG